MTVRYLLGLEEIGKEQAALAGGKGANLGELSRIDGIRVPDGFCVTTDAFRRVMGTVPRIDNLLGRLSGLDSDDRQAIGPLSAEIRLAVEETAVPDDLAAAITVSVARLGERTACAVRSSATAEDLPTASFAGQQDTYLNVAGPAAVLAARQPVLGLAVHRTGRGLPPAQRLSTTGRSRWPWSCSGWWSRMRRASCSPPTRSPATGGSSRSRPASASARRWYPAW